MDKGLEYLQELSGGPRVSAVLMTCCLAQESALRHGGWGSPEGRISGMLVLLLAGISFDAAVWFADIKISHVFN